MSERNIVYIRRERRQLAAEIEAAEARGEHHKVLELRGCALRLWRELVRLEKRLGK